MQNIDKKIMYILRLNSKLKKIELYINSNKTTFKTGIPNFMKKDIEKAIQKKEIIKNVLINLNYLNY